MKKCNKCNNSKPDALFRVYKGKRVKTCKQCEFSWKRTILRFLAYRRKLTAWEKFASRIGYMGAGFLMAGQWTVEPLLFIAGFCCVLVQVSSRKQWNLVILQLNGLIAWTLHFIKTLG